MKLPKEDFRWIEEEEREQLFQELSEMDLDGDTGYVFEVDLHIPSEVHDQLDDLPLAPENRLVNQPTEYMLQLWSLAEGRPAYRPGKKLLLSHLDKERYVIHGKLLQFYLKMKIQVSKVHRIVQFKQEAFFEEFISFNSHKRQHAQSEFEKDFFKLKNNSLFGKYVCCLMF